MINTYTFVYLSGKNLTQKCYLSIKLIDDENGEEVPEKSSENLKNEENFLLGHDFIVCISVWDKGSISPTFYAQLLRQQ
jgi:hypothetical protein